MNNAINTKRMEAIQKAAYFDGNMINVLISMNDVYRERSRVASEIISCKNERSLEELNKMFDYYSDQIKLVLGLI